MSQFPGVAWEQMDRPLTRSLAHLRQSRIQSDPTGGPLNHFGTAEQGAPQMLPQQSLGDAYAMHMARRQGPGQQSPTMVQPGGGLYFAGSNVGQQQRPMTASIGRAKQAAMKLANLQGLAPEQQQDLQQLQDDPNVGLNEFENVMRQHKNAKPEKAYEPSYADRLTIESDKERLKDLQTGYGQKEGKNEQYGDLVNGPQRHDEPDWIQNQQQQQNVYQNMMGLARGPQTQSQPSATDNPDTGATITTGQLPQREVPGMTMQRTGGSKPIDHGTAMQFYQQAGGDPEKARQLARQAGFAF